MKSFKTQILESKKYNVLTNKDMEQYLKDMKKDLPKNIVDITNSLIKYEINDESIFNRIKNGSKIDLKLVSKELGVGENDIEKLQDMIRKAGDDADLVPLLIDPEDMKSLSKGDKTLEDISLDLISDKGRTKVVKKYSPMAVTIAAKYRGKSGLDWNGLISAANLGLVKAMNDYKRGVSIDNEDEKMKKLSFKQYAGYRIKQQILNDINDLSRTVRVTQYQFDKAKSKGEDIRSIVSIDTSVGEEGTLGNVLGDVEGLYVDPDAEKVKDNKQLEKIYELIDKKFSDKILSIFYSYFGLHGYKKMSGVELARKYNCTGAYISIQVKKVVSWLQENKQARPLLQELLDIYSESLITGFYNKDLDEELANDKIFLMLVEAWEETSLQVLINRIGECLDNFSENESLVIEKCLLNGDFNMIDENYDEYKESMKKFIMYMNPTKSTEMTDIDIIESLINIHKQLEEFEK